MPTPLIRALDKLALPDAPLGFEGAVPIVGGSASVPVELRISAASQQVPVGVHIVFVIDNSGSMDPDPPHSDPDGKRYAAIQSLVEAFAPTRNALDRIALITFQGSEATDDLRVHVDEAAQPWKTWSEVAARIPVLRSIGAQSATPLAAAMRQADALLAQSDSFYRLTVLISDGLPTPDNDEVPQTSTIVNEIIPTECIPNRIQCSTIYLYTQPPEDNALLIYIARQTDYVTAYQTGDPPAYYFRITSPDQIVHCYRAMFDRLKERQVPQDVRIAENVDARLLIDADAPVTLAGSGFDEARNLLGGVPLATLLAQFRSTRSLALHFNELQGELVLRFSVKLNQTSITDAEYAAGSVLTNVDVASASTISWLEPDVPCGGLMRTLALPQARIKFKLGLHVDKSLAPDGVTMNVQASNVDARTVKAFELAEYPSSYLDATRIADSFGAHPFRMLYANRIVPWFLRRVPVAGLSDRAVQALLRRVRDGLQNAHAAVLAKEVVLDGYLGDFGFGENKPGSGECDAFWNALSQRGQYRYLDELPPHATRSLTYALDGASYLLQSGPDRMLNKPADALESKGLLPLSEFTAAGLGTWVTLLPNPMHYQIVSASADADLFLRTCFSADHVYLLADLLRGTGNLSNPWAMLDSGDITPIWRPATTRPRIGATVQIHNGGDAASAPTTVRVVSVYLPYSEKDLQPPRPPHPPGGPIDVSMPFFGTADVAVPSVAARARWSADVLFRRLLYMPIDGAPTEVQAATLLAVKDAIVITTVDVTAAGNERMRHNNSAIEIVPLRGP